MAKHEAGPFGEFMSAATASGSLLGGFGVGKQRKLTDQLIGDIQSNPETQSLGAIAEAGKAPMTKEQHAEFRAGLMQAAMSQHTLNAGYQDFSERMDAELAAATRPDDIDTLKNLKAFGNYSHSLINSGDPELRTKGIQQLGESFTGLRTYSTAAKDLNIQLEGQVAAGRDKEQDHFQGLLDSQVNGPRIQDNIEYETLMSQLSGLKPDENVPPSLTSAALPYTMAALRQSEDGHWSFSVAGVGFQDQDVPVMTASELRNRVNQAREGRQGAISAAGDELQALAGKKGFNVNGAAIDDLVYLKAGQERNRIREEQFAPKPLTTDQVKESAASGAKAAQEGIEGAVRGVVGDAPIDAAQGFVTNLIELGTTRIPGTDWLAEFLSGTKPQLPPVADESKADESVPSSAAERARRRANSGGKNLSGAPARAPLPTNDPQRVPR